MRLVGIALLVVALGIGVYAAGIDTRVCAPDAGSVNDIGLMNDQQSAFIDAGLVAVTGVGVIIVAGIRRSRRTSGQGGTAAHGNHV